MTTSTSVDDARVSPSQRRVRRNLLLGAVSGGASAGLVALLPVDDLVTRWSMATAYVALALLLTCLIIGPLNVLRQRPNPVSTQLRRDIGIWGGSVGLLHLVVGLNVHLRGRPWLYFIYDRGDHHRIPLRHDLFGFANFTGLAAGIVLAVLLAISNDAALRGLGTAKWKRWQRWNYVGTGLFVLHGAAFMLIEKRVLPVVALCAAALGTAIVLQLAGVARVRRGE